MLLIKAQLALLDPKVQLAYLVQAVPLGLLAQLVQRDLLEVQVLVVLLGRQDYPGSLACLAKPDPVDYLEFLAHLAFLEILAPQVHLVCQGHLDQ